MTERRRAALKTAAVFGALAAWIGLAVLAAALGGEDGVAAVVLGPIVILVLGCVVFGVYDAFLQQERRR